MRIRSLVPSLFALGWWAFLLGFRPHPSFPVSSRSASPKPIIRLNSAYGKLPLAFEPNQGQANPQVKFLSRGNGYALFVTSREAVLSLQKPERFDLSLPARSRGNKAQPLPSPASTPTVLHLKLEGAQANPTIETGDRLPGISNYFIGKDPAGWHTKIPQYSKVTVHGPYPGVDMVYYGNQGKLEYDFVVQPGGDPSVIRLKVEGAQAAQVNGQGDLELATGQGRMIFRAPVIYQETAGQRNPVEGRYKLEEGNRLGFEVKDYDPSKPLVIDPVLDYSTYLGGSAADSSMGIAVDGSGNAYISGTTTGAFPTTSGAFQTTFGGDNDVFVSKLDPSGTTLIYSTYLGGIGDDYGQGIAVDGSGNAYVTGAAYDTFPVTSGAYQTTFYGGGVINDAFVTKLNSAGTSLVYSTFLGGSPGAWGFGITVDGSGDAYVTGWNQGGFPTSSGAYQTSFSGDYFDAFVTELNPSGSALLYSTNLGGSADAMAFSIALDGPGTVCVAGYTDGNFPTTSGAFQTTSNGGEDAFVAELNLAGNGTSDLLYSTFIGGTYSEAFGVAVDGSGDAYVTGEALGGVTTTPGAFQTTWGGGQGPFVSELNPSGSGLLYSTYLGGSAGGRGGSIAVDGSGNIYVAGYTGDTLPTTSGAYQTTYGGGSDNAFFSMIDPAGNGAGDLVYSTYLGGSGGALGYGIALDSVGGVYVSGSTDAGFPTTSGAYQTAIGGSNNAFVVKFDVTQPNPSTSTPTSTPTSTSSWTPSMTSTSTPTPTSTPSATSTPTITPTPNTSFTATATSSLTATSTASWTPTMTPTSTPTLSVTPTAAGGGSGGLGFLGTVTPSWTPTPLLAGFIIGPPYPNPCKGQGPVNIQVLVPPGTTVEWSVFTTAFRRVFDGPAATQGTNLNFTWNLEDDWQRPVANGLYYLRFETITPTSRNQKILKILVTR